ncbi:MAG: hypothetical protein DRH56_09595 [Deltaproteobacteria bacterium]|nr:MAG: hypothetical protein DRH56_09595 [Deltaproteobacteria bacterium]
MSKIKLLNGVIWIVLVLFLASLPVYAGDADRIGTAAGTQVLVPVGARDLAMAGSDIVFTKGTDAIYWNPAGLSNMTQHAAGMFSTVNIFGDIRVNYLAVGAGMGKFGHIGFSIKAFDFGDIPLTTIEDMDGSNGRTFSPTFSTIGLTYSNKLTNTINVGITTKLIYESAPRVSATAVAFDIGLQYKNLAGIKGVSFGVVAKNIGSNMQYHGTGLMQQVKVDGRNEFVRRGAAKDELPASLELGLSYNYKVMEDNSIIVSGVFRNNNVQNDEFRFGMEYNYKNFIMLRGGYLYMVNTSSDDVVYSFSLGAGLQYKLGNTMLGIDYAFRDVQYFDASNMFTLHIGF